MFIYLLYFYSRFYVCSLYFLYKFEQIFILTSVKMQIKYKI